MFYDVGPIRRTAATAETKLLHVCFGRQAAPSAWSGAQKQDSLAIHRGGGHWDVTRIRQRILHPDGVSDFAGSARVEVFKDAAASIPTTAATAASKATRYCPFPQWGKIQIDLFKIKLDFVIELRTAELQVKIWEHKIEMLPKKLGLILTKIGPIISRHFLAYPGKLFRFVSPKLTKNRTIWDENCHWL